MVANVEFRVEIAARQGRAEGVDGAALELRLLGPLTVIRGGERLAMPPSRKVRALLAYLTVTRRPVTRSHLSQLLWDLPNDPRGELRWCLSKLRTVVDEPGRERVVTAGDTVAIDLTGDSVDVWLVNEALQQGLAAVSAEHLETLDALFVSQDFLDGLDLPRSPAFSSWLLAERRRIRAAHAAVLDHRVKRLPRGGPQALAALERWVNIAPFDRQAHEKLLEALAVQGRLQEGEEHLSAIARRFEAEGQDWVPIGRAWATAKAQLRGEAGAVALAVSGEESWAAEASPSPAPARRASLAVMPFLDRTPGATLRGGLGDGMAHDVITRLAKLRSMFVIAEGTMFRLSERRVGWQEAGRRLDVDYVASGSLRRGANSRLLVTVQLTETQNAKVVWAEEFSGRLDDTFSVLDEIGNRIVSAMASQIELAERNRAVLKNPSSLNAWEAHHRGLWHMVRFNREDNEQARQFFQTAVRLDPTFARPHAGLSFTHFQDAFLGWNAREPAIEAAYAAASEALMADEGDPAAHWALGRAMWLQSRHDQALLELHSAIDLSPNFAMGHYTLAWFHCQAGDPEAAIAGVDHARALSPMDPLLFAMFASRALALLRLARFEEAAEWSVRSASRPNAHLHIKAVAMYCLALAGKVTEAKAFALAIRESNGAYHLDDFLRAFRLPPETVLMLHKAARLIAE